MANTHEAVFNGTTAYFVRTDGSDALDITGDFTIETWFNTNDNTARQFLVNKFTGGTGGYWLEYNGTLGTPGVTLGVSNAGTTDEAIISWTPSNNTRYHIAAVFDDSADSWELLIDGVSQGTGSDVTQSPSAGTEDLHIGANQTPGNYMNGELDEIRIWNVARTQTQIRQFMGVGDVSGETGIVAHYRFNNGITDSSGNGLDLTTNNNVTFSTSVPFEDDTFWPDANPETTSVDGVVGNTDAGWSTTHDAATGDEAGPSSTEDEAASSRDVDGGTNYQIKRGFFLFDTSAIPDVNTISAATFSLYVTGKTNNDNDGDDYVNVYSTTPASNTNLTTADFDAIGTTAYATEIDIGSITTSQYNDWTLNATGIAAVSKTGITKLGIREGHDAEDLIIAPGGAGRNKIDVYFADNGIATAPKLVVTHEVAAAGGGKTLTLMGVGR